MVLPALGQVSVLTQHNDRERTGTNLRETVLTPADVNAKQFGMPFKRAVDDQLYGQPLVVTAVVTDGMASVSWGAVAGARTYTVASSLQGAGAVQRMH